MTFTLQKLKNYCILIFILGNILLIFPLIFGTTINGAKSWIQIAGISIQISELAKITTILMLSYFFSLKQTNFNHIKTFFQALLILFIPYFLIFLQPDLGTGLIFAAIFFNCLLLSNIRFKVLFIFFLLGCFSLPIIFSFLRPHQQNRIKVFSHPIIHPIITQYAEYVAKKNNLNEKIIKKSAIYRTPYAFISNEINFNKKLINKKKYLENKKNFATNQKFLLYESWQSYQTTLAIATGGIQGKGYRQGTQYSSGYIPLGICMTDCIFPVIAEEGGFIESLFIIGLYITLCIILVQTAFNSPDPFGKLLCLNILAMFVIHIFINIGMSLGLFPIIGLSLPFISYGGSFIISCMLGIALIQIVSIENKTNDNLYK